MKKLVLLTAFAFAVSASSGFAQSAGQFGFGIELTGMGTLALNNGVATLYAFDHSGGTNSGAGLDTRLKPNGSNATQSLAWTGASTAAAPTFSLGTFMQTDSLDLDGASYLTYKNGGANVTGTELFYRITPGVGGSGGYLPALNLTFNQDNVNGNNGDQRWSVEPGTTIYPASGPSYTYSAINLISGLAPGTYTLSVYGEGLASSGNFYENNGGGGGLDYSATFIVVPEPNAWAMMLGGLGLLVVVRRFRSQRV